MNPTPPQRILPVLSKVKDTYILWQRYLPVFPKTSRYTLGDKIDKLFIEAIESISTAIYLDKTEKLPYIRHSIKKIDTLKLFLQIAWEIKALDNNKYAQLSVGVIEISKMVGGWHNQIRKQNSPTK
jgi:hypothetical protein